MMNYLYISNNTICYLYSNWKTLVTEGSIASFQQESKFQMHLHFSRDVITEWLAQANSNKNCQVERKPNKTCTRPQDFKVTSYLQISLFKSFSKCQLKYPEGQSKHYSNVKTAFWHFNVDSKHIYCMLTGLLHALLSCFIPLLSLFM